MYLTRLILNPRSRRVQREIGEPYQLHRTILSAFPEVLPEDERVLFRLEIDQRSGRPTLLIQSQGMPDWDWITNARGERYLMKGEDPNPWVKAYNPEFLKGQSLIFRLRANPTVKRAGKRLGLYKEEDQIEWLQRKAEASGFAIYSTQVKQEDWITGPLYREKEQHELRLLVVQFDGLLEVLEAVVMLKAIRNGIGSGKGLGCGLLSVAPVTRR